MRSPCCFLLCFLILLPSVNGWISGETIAQTADEYINSTDWSKAGWYSYRFRWDRDKCNLFVADVVTEAGGEVPHRDALYSPIGAGEWGNPQSTYLTNDDCWSRVFSPSRGDVIGGQGHVGIVTGSQLTTSAGEFKVKKNNWGYRPENSGMVFWRYSC